MIAALIAGIAELVGAGTASQHGVLFPHAQRRCPAVEPLQIAGIGGDVRNALDLSGQVVGTVLMVLAQFVEHIALIHEKHADTQSEQQHHPLHLHSHAYQHIHANGTQHTQPCGAAVGEEQTHQQQRHDGKRQQSRPTLAGSAEKEVERCRQHQCNHAAVGCMVIVEWLHDTVQGLQVAEVAHCLGGGKADDGNQPDGVAPEELAYAGFVAENLGGCKKERHHKPQPRQPVFERHEGH